MPKNFVSDDSRAGNDIRVRNFVANDRLADSNIRVRNAASRSPRLLRNLAYSLIAVLGLVVGLVGTLDFNAAGATEEAPALIEMSETEDTEEAPLIIDVRTAEEFEAGHIEGAINIPLDADPDEFRAQIDALDRSGDFILHCGTGARADRVAEFMADQGFTGLIGSYSLEEAVNLSGVNIIGDLTAADAVNPTITEADGAENQRMCAITGDSLFGVTRP